MPSQKPIIHLVHIPKTAGTTLSRIIRLKYTLWPPTRLPKYWLVCGYPTLPLAERAKVVTELPPRKRKQVRLIQGHCGFGFHELLDTPIDYVTVLRDPLERVTSSYYQLKRKGDLPDGLEMEDWIRGGVSYTQGFWIDNGQVRALAGSQGNSLAVPFGEVTAEHLALAKQRIDKYFLVAGLTERFDETLLLMKKLLGWRSVYYASANIAPNRSRLSGLPESTVDLMRHHNQLDIDLYQHVEQRFDEQIMRELPDLEVQLARFRRRNKRYGQAMGPFIEMMSRARQRFMRTPNEARARQA